MPRPSTLGAAPPPPPLGVVQEFFAKPYGPHGVELQHLLNQMRAAPVSRKLVLLVVVANREWRLARLPDARGGQLDLLPGASFTLLADAECAAFRIRWQEVFATQLPEEIAQDV